MQRSLLLVTALLVPLVVAAQPAATVFTSGPLKINGVQMANAGIPSFPLAAGDEIATTANQAIIVFPDGSRITMGKGARAKLSTEGPRGIDLLAGTAVYKSTSLSTFGMRAFGRPVNLQSLSEGVVSITGPDKVAVRAKVPGDDADISKMKHNKPKPRSNHGKHDEEP
jgi:hypothetical protein